MVDGWRYVTVVEDVALIEGALSGTLRPAACEILGLNAAARLQLEQTAKQCFEDKARAMARRLR